MAWVVVLAVLLVGCSADRTDPVVFSTTWVSDDVGWVLAAHPSCGSTCAATLFHTEDRGRSWDTLEGPIPPVERHDHPQELDPQVRFANRQDGWMLTPDLWATHDGGKSWHEVDLPDRVTSLETANGSVHAVTLGDDGVRVWTATVDRDDFEAASVVTSLGNAPEPTTQLVLAGEGGWMLVNNLVLVGGAVLEDGTWTAFDPPCLDRFAPVRLAASSPADVVALCNEGLFGRVPSGFHLYESTDGGQTFPVELPLQKVAQNTVFGFARPDDESLVVATQPTEQLVMETTVSFDDGETWSELVELGNGLLGQLSFSSSHHGVAILAQSPYEAGGIFSTEDGGLTWTELDLPTP
jgi:hypothetical protein